MILVGSERGNSSDLARHLLNDQDGNEHITVHELRGFVSDDLSGALKESYAISRGTKCRKHLFSCSFNPPANEDVTIEGFKSAINRVERQNGLDGQPRAIVFHEKEGRRHAHCVWSKIDADNMTAINLPHYKLKLQSVSRQLYHEHDWKMPEGLARKGHADPRNYTLAEYQQAKRMNVDARDIKGSIQDAYAVSDNATSFSHALSERGYILAKGDRRGHVVVSHSGEVLSVARYVGKKAKDIRGKLGEPDGLRSVDEAKHQMVQDMRKAFIRHGTEANSLKAKAQEHLIYERDRLVQEQKDARNQLNEIQKRRWLQETTDRSNILNSGLRGFWQLLTGQKAKIQAQNKREAIIAQERDRKQHNEMIAEQMKERRQIRDRQDRIKAMHDKTMQEIRDDQKQAREANRALRDHIQNSRNDGGVVNKPPRDDSERER